MSAATELKKAPAGASDMAHIVLTFDNNRLASALYGPFDENLALIEQKLGVDVRSKGNQLTVMGDPDAAEQARRALDYLYGLVQKGADLARSDVEGAVRMAVAADGGGYYLVARDGGVFTFGSARFLGSAVGRPGFVGPATALAPTPTGLGYWILDAAGTLHTFGDAPAFGGGVTAGSRPALALVPVVRP